MKHYLITNCAQFIEIINRNNVSFIMHDKAIVAKSPGDFVSENVGLIKFKGIYGLQAVKEIDAKLLKEILANS